nr:hypothetical protein [Myxococcota bacterium]
MSAPIDDVANRSVSRRAWLAVPLAAFFVVASFATCFFAFRLAPRRAGDLLCAALEVMGGRASATHRTFAAGAMFLGHVALLIIGVVLASGAVPPWIHDEPVRRAVGVALGLLLPAGIAAACAPFA